MGITLRTVEFHQRNIKDRFGAATMPAAIHIAHHKGYFNERAVFLISSGRPEGYRIPRSSAWRSARQLEVMVPPADDLAADLQVVGQLR
jgi:hypothetical protein